MIDGISSSSSKIVTSKGTKEGHMLSLTLKTKPLLMDESDQVHSSLWFLLS